MLRPAFQSSSASSASSALSASSKEFVRTRFGVERFDQENLLGFHPKALTTRGQDRKPVTTDSPSVASSF
tara:strand:+ start:1881 stop:2090 length:210 start_codon:yes stop_codon:yes gene_type:complete